MDESWSPGDPTSCRYCGGQVTFLCRKTAVHAEQDAILAAGSGCLNASMLHVKVVDGQLVASGEPSCVECSKLILRSGIKFMWLFHETGWKEYTADEFHKFSLQSVVNS